jgi:predicted anti-sigma-YlaC factor YlaD
MEEIMNADRHEIFQLMIDKTLAGEVSLQEGNSLREHLQTCAQCRGYLSANTRAIASLGGFSFEVSPELHAKVCASLRLRSQQLESRQLSRKRVVWSCIIALGLTVVGSVLDLQFGSLAATVLGFQPGYLRRELINFWIGPSFWLLLLFPMLPMLLTPGKNRKGSAL